MRWWRGGMALALAGALSACALILPGADGAAAREARWQAHAAQLAALTDWDLRGRIGVHTDGRADAISVVWRRHAEMHHVELFGPFGSGRVAVDQTPAGARLIDAHGNIYRAADAAALLFERTGLRLPLAEIAYWVTGQPAPGVAERRVDAEGRLTSLRQAGWRVEFITYTEVEGLDLPRKLVAHASAGTVDGAKRGPLTIKVVVSQWVLPPAA